jgi:hypothetical protein
MESALQECKHLLLHHFGGIMNAGENSMAWFYEIRDSNKVVVEKGRGFCYAGSALNAGRKSARKLKVSLSSQSGTVETLVTGKTSEVVAR